MRNRSWTDEQLIKAVKNNYSYRSVISALGLVPAGGNYAQVQAKIKTLGLSTGHFTGSRWNIGRTYHTSKRLPLALLLVEGSSFQSYKLKKRLFDAGLKQAKCEICGWRKKSVDGRIPLELDHINGDHYDNRLCNLRILCPNCHSLQLNHRGKNKKVARRIKI